MHKVTLKHYGKVTGDHLHDEIVYGEMLVTAIVSAVLKGQTSGYDFLVVEAPGAELHQYWGYRAMGRNDYTADEIRSELGSRYD